MCYYVKFKGLRNKTIVREKPTKQAALDYVAYLERHGVSSVMGTIRADGQLARPRKEVA